MLVDSPVQWNLSIQNHPVLIHRAVMSDALVKMAENVSDIQS